MEYTGDCDSTEKFDAGTLTYLFYWKCYFDQIKLKQTQMYGIVFIFLN